MTLASEIEETLEDIEKIIIAVRGMEEKKSSIEKNKDQITELFTKKQIEKFNDLKGSLALREFSYLNGFRDSVPFRVDSKSLKEEYRRIKPKEIDLKRVEKNMLELKGIMEKKHEKAAQPKRFDHYTLMFLERIL